MPGFSRATTLVLNWPKNLRNLTVLICRILNISVEIVGVSDSSCFLPFLMPTSQSGKALVMYQKSLSYGILGWPQSRARLQNPLSFGCRHAAPLSGGRAKGVFHLCVKDPHGWPWGQRTQVPAWLCPQVVLWLWASHFSNHNSLTLIVLSF